MENEKEKGEAQKITDAYNKVVTAFVEAIEEKGENILTPNEGKKVIRLNSGDTALPHTKKVRDLFGVAERKREKLIYDEDNDVLKKH